MSLKRRQFLMFLGATAGTVTLGNLSTSNRSATSLLQTAPAFASNGRVGFSPVKSPMPLAGMGMDAATQISEYARFTVQDDLVLPEGYTYDVIAAWGDPLGDSRFGYNNDYLSFIETKPGEGYLTVNFEYVSAETWMAIYPQVIGKDLPFDEIKAAAEIAGEGGIDVYGMGALNPMKAKLQALCEEALVDLGIGVIYVKRQPDGRWLRVEQPTDRRITGVSGLKDGRYLKSTGPSTAVFQKTSGEGHLDDLGDRIIGTFNNCAGGTTPWGTVMSAEENYQDFVPEGVHADGTSLHPSEQPFTYVTDGFTGLGSAFGYAGNKYGWMVEVDPANPNDYGTKHTWLGRYRHEAVAVRAVSGKRLAVYSGCDRRGGHLYKFVSAGTVRNPQDKANSQFFNDGMLYAAKFNADGTGTWLALTPETPINPDMPSMVEGGMIPLPKRPEGGIVKVDSDEAMMAFKGQYRTLGDLYTGSALEKQGAILIDAHFAGNAIGATNTARPEDTDLAADGTLFIAYTSGSAGGDGGPHREIFQGPGGISPYEFGWIMKLQEDGSDPAAMTFRWEMFALGGEPAEGGLGFANPDNLEIDRNGNLWMVTDMSSDKHNRAVPSRIDAEGKAVSQSNLRGLYGNNSIWYIPTSGPQAGEAFMFGYGPMDCEMCGPFLTQDMTTLFLAAQHPGEINGARREMATEVRQFAMMTTDSQEFIQEREVPIGSNWPTKVMNDPPKPAVVAVRRIDGGRLA